MKEVGQVLMRLVKTRCGGQGVELSEIQWWRIHRKTEAGDGRARMHVTVRRERCQVVLVKILSQF